LKEKRFREVTSNGMNASEKRIGYIKAPLVTDSCPSVTAGHVDPSALLHINLTPSKLSLSSRMKRRKHEWEGEREREKERGRERELGRERVMASG